MNEKNNHMPTMRVISILTTIADNPDGLSLSEISSITNLAKSTIFPTLHTLKDQSFISYDEVTQKYFLGIQTFSLGQKFLYQFKILDYVKSKMTSIVDICNETCHFGILLDNTVLYLHKQESKQSLRMYSAPGKKIPAYGTGLGKALLSDCDLNSLKALYPDGLKPLTPSTITDFDVLYKQLKTTKLTGLAYEYTESDPYLQCVAVTIEQNQQVKASLSIAMPTFRATDEQVKLCESILLKAKQDIELLLCTMDIDFNRLI